MQNVRMFGTVCASVTPMTENEKVDYDSVKPLVAYMQQIGVNGLYPIGTTGESMVLEREERVRLAHAFADANAGKTPLFLQCGDWNLERTKENIRIAKDVGAAGVGVMLPAFFPCDDRAIEAYYTRVLEAFPDETIYLYNIPRNAANDLSTAVYERLLERFDNCAGIKYSSPDMQRTQEYENIGRKKGAQILTGSEFMYFAAMQIGAVGCISGCCVAFPEAYMNLYPKYIAGDIEGARKQQRFILETKRLTAGIPAIAMMKAVLKKKGVIANDACRSPLRRLEKEEYRRIDEALVRYQALASEYR